MNNQNVYKIIGEILLNSSQFLIGYIEMRFKFLIINFSNDQNGLQNATNILIDHFKIILLWTIGSSLNSYSNFGKDGLYINIIINIIIIGWILYTYHTYCLKITQKYKLKYPNLY